VRFDFQSVVARQFDVAGCGLVSAAMLWVGPPPGWWGWHRGRTHTWASYEPIEVGAWIPDDRL
jgi:hypothetical protein